jgi:beta-lactam-binding protein with PASTA domain
MAEPPRVPPDPDDETVIVPPEDETVVADDWGSESEVFVEEEETGPPPPRRPVIWPWLLALLVFVLGGLGAYFLLTRDDDEAQAPTTSSTVSTTTTRQVTVPDVVGTTSSEATATLRDEGLTVNLVSVPSDRSPGTVIAQNPSPGEEVTEGSSVRLNVAETAKPAPTTTEAKTTAPTTTAPTTTAAPEPEPATVPDVVGQELADAARTFNEEGLKVAVVYVPSNEPAGSVVAQARPPGAKLQSGDTVQLNVSTGAEPAPDVQVPDVTGEKQNGGREQLKSAGFEVLTLQEKTTDRSRVGSVLSQTPSGGANIPRGSLVIVYVGA